MTVRALVIDPGASTPQLRDVTPDLASMQALVGGDLEGINAVPGAVWHGYFNAEPFRGQFDPNPLATELLRQLGFSLPFDILGTVVFLGTKGSDEDDVPEWIVATLTEDLGRAVEVSS